MIELTFSLAVAAFSLGFFSSGHCLFMCGGIASALSSQTHKQSTIDRIIKILAFHSGRIVCYSFLGLTLGTLIHQFAKDYHLFSLILRHVAGVLLILIGLYIAGFGKLLKSFESKFSFIWKKLQPLVKPLTGMQKKRHALALGFLWGFLPCGIIYSTLLWASATTQGPMTAVVMLLFGLGTLPGFFLLNIFNQRVIRFLSAKGVKLGVGCLFIFFGLWTILSLFPQLTPLDHPFCL